MVARAATRPIFVRSLRNVTVPAGVMSAALGVQLSVRSTGSIGRHLPRNTYDVEAAVAFEPSALQRSSAKTSMMSCEA